MKKYVIDASVILSLILPGEVPTQSFKQLFEEFLHEQINFLAPHLLKLETANALKSSVLSKRTTEEKALAIYKRFLGLKINYEEVELEDILKISFKTHLSVYDSAYVFLAQKNNSSVLTLDKRLNKAQNKS